MTLHEELTVVPSPSLERGGMSPSAGEEETDSRHQWDINDSNLPLMPEVEDYVELPVGHCKHVYREESEEARRHCSGWAMRNTNNHNVNILKKSCLGVLVCSRRCTFEDNSFVHLRPAICDKARKKQLGKACSNPRCDGRLELQACRGHCGYPVTHFWRHINGLIFFQGKGTHDHPMPEAKSSAEVRRHTFKDRHSLVERPRVSKKRPMSSASYPPTKIQHIENFDHYAAKPVPPCCCSPFECSCNARVSANVNTYVSSAQQAMPAGQPNLDTKAPFVELQDLQISPVWREYNKYFDFSSEVINDCLQASSQPSSATPFPDSHITQHHYELSVNLNNLPKSTTSSYPSRSAYLNGAVKSKELSSCMYSSSSDYSSMSPQSSPSSLSTVNSSRNADSSLDVSRSTDSAHSASPEQVSPVSSTGHCGSDNNSFYASSFCITDTSTSNHMLSDLDFRDVNDILSLDQPFHKDRRLHSPKASYHHPQNDGGDPLAPCLNDAKLTETLDLSTLLPAIGSIFTEDQVSAATPSGHSHSHHNTNQSSSPLRGASPHSLTELQPLHVASQTRRLSCNSFLAEALSASVPKSCQALSQLADCRHAADAAYHPSTEQYLNCKNSVNVFRGGAQNASNAVRTPAPEVFDSFSFFNGDICAFPPSSHSLSSNKSAILSL